MCGSFERYVDGYLYNGQLGQIDFKFSKLGECKPSQTIDVISYASADYNQQHRGHAIADKTLQLQAFNWGLKTQWSPKLLINARLETVTQKPSFSEAFAYRRCLIVLSAWHEWRDEGGAKKQQYRFSYQHRQALVMAGIYYPATEQSVNGSFVSLTCAPSPKFSQYHHRMPFLLRDPEAYLQGNFNAARAVRELHLGDSQMAIEAV
ncbi:hypothetical protein DBZ36_09010 [Alginatibacterium sediminis]|uniref:Abasic site processing protein n=1 Tax=Alginatibacterium sediminis TaxID=2164068 RepID=A0A420ECZ1_9ALTE|nr:SOS response-associated peptidase family protein [Alginatibacterium sediminis]RKF18538.1 hypothetical protein DBZ36_09010 [Alginatibacterium sediminis]